MKFNPKEFFSKAHLLNHIGFKIVSLIIAILLWVVVVNITDPVIPQTIRNVPVRFLNESLIESQGKTIRVLDGTDIVPSVTVRAPRSVLQEMGNTSDYFMATADFSKLAADGSSVPIEFTTTKYSDKVESIRSNSDRLLVEIENRKTVTLPIHYTTSGEIADGYILGKVTLGQNQIRVSGPESVIASISKASVDVMLTGFTEDISTLSDIVFYDADGEVVPNRELTLNMDNVRVNVEILATKRVPIYYATIGSPAEGYALTGTIDCDPDTVVIAGTTADIDDVTLVNIPASELNVTGQKANLSTVLDLEKYLPERIRIGDSKFNGKVSFTVYIEPLITDYFGVYMRNVEIRNIPDGFEAEFDEPEDNVEFSLTGLAQDLERLALSTLNYRVDFMAFGAENGVKEYHDGIYNLDLLMDLPTGITQKDTVRIKVKLISPESEEGENTETKKAP